MKKKLMVILMVFLLWTIDYGLLTIQAEEEKPTAVLSSYALDNPNLLRKVSLDLRDINIPDTIRYLAEKADINVAVSKNVGGRITLSFKNVTIKDALDIVLLSNDLAAESRGEIIYIMLAKDYETLHGTKWADPRQVKIFKLQYARPPDVSTVLGTLKSKVGSIVVDNESGTVVIMDTPERIAKMKEAISSMDKESLTQVFELKYAKALEVEKNLRSRLDAKGIGTIKADERSNQVVVTALPKRMSEVEKIIQELDRKTRQVLIEAKIVKVSLSPDFDMGIEWEKVFTKSSYYGLQSLDLVASFPISSAVSTATSLGTVGKVSVGTLEGDQYTTVIKFLKTIGETKLLSSPRIAAINNEEAKILIGTREAYITKTVTQGESTTTTASSVTFLDVGVQLYVTPTINEDGFVTMKIRPEVSSVGRTLTTAEGDEIPIVDTTTAETTVMVKDGHTIIIGGLIKDETVRTTKKIPILGDIPLLGMLFRQIDEDKEKTELVVFLTPHIISGDKDMASWEEKEIRGLRGYSHE